MTGDKVAAYLREAGLEPGETITRENAHVLVKAFNLVRDDALDACRAVADSYTGSAHIPTEYEERGARRAAALICLTAVNNKLEN